MIRILVKGQLFEDLFYNAIRAGNKFYLKTWKNQGRDNRERETRAWLGS